MAALSATNQQTLKMAPVTAFRSSSKKGKRNVLFIGWNQRSQEHIEDLSADRFRGVNILGVLDTPEQLTKKDAHNTKITLNSDENLQFGDVAELASILKSNPVDEVFITLPIKSCYDDIQEIVAICEEAGTPFSLPTNLFGTTIAQAGGNSWSGSQDRVTYTCVTYPKWKLAIKRAMDIAGALFALTVLAIPMLIIAALIKLTSKGPVFFCQERAGKNHKRFKMIKFRTMVTDAEKIKEQLVADNEQDGPAFKMKNDPRITWIGRILRKTSLDELPQFINVLLGEMSIVGPRPPIIAEVDEYEWWQRRRLSMRPGLTCFWQVSGRNEISFEEWMQLDLKYIDNWSLWIDVKLILKTVVTVIRGTGS